MGIIARTVRALVAEIMSQEFVVGLRAKGMTWLGIFRHVVKNVAPTALAVMGIQLGYLLGGSILIETVFSWPGTGFPAQLGDLPARPAAAAGHHPGAGAVLRRPQSRGRRAADRARSARGAALMAVTVSTHAVADRADRSFAELLADGGRALPPRPGGDGGAVRGAGADADGDLRAVDRAGRSQQGHDAAPAEAGRHARLSARHRRTRPRHALAPDHGRAAVAVHGRDAGVPGAAASAARIGIVAGYAGGSSIPC